MSTRAEAEKLRQANMEQAFYEMCKRHDLTYVYSDDGRVYAKGRQSLEEIEAAAAKLPPGVAAQIWNRVVDEKILAEHRTDWYWK